MAARLTSEREIAASEIRGHRRLAELCGAAEKIVATRVREELGGCPNLGQPALSKAARESLQESKEGREIERLAARLLPKQAE